MTKSDVKYAWNWREQIEEAINEGFTVIRSNKNLILLDLDSEEDLKLYVKTVKLIGHYFELQEISRYVSQSGKHYHVILNCKDLDFKTRIGLQCALGSDRKRELLAMCILEDTGDEVSFLFKPEVKI